MVMNSINTDKIISIVLIEDNRFIRNGWEIEIKKQPFFEIIGSFESCEKAFKTDPFNETDVVLMDISLPGMSGIEGVKYLREKFPKLIVVMCTVHDDDEKIFDAICAGAVGYLLKKTHPKELVNSLRDAYNGGSPMTPSVARRIISSFQKSPAKSFTGEIIELTDREKQILNLMSQGKTYTTIAKEIFLSVDGVYYHIRNIYEKLQVHSRAEAVAEGLKKRLIQPPRK